MSEGRLVRIAGVSGISGIVVLLVANVQLGTPPNADDPAPKIARFLTDHRTSVLLLAVLFPVAYLLLVLFAAGLRGMLERAGDTSGLPRLVFAAAVWVIVVGTVSVIATGAAAFRAPALDPNAAQALFDVNNIGFALIGVPFAVLFGAASVSSMSTRALPRWIAWVGILAGVLNVAKVFTVLSRSGGLSPGGGFSLAAVVPIWIWTVAVGVVMGGRFTHASSSGTAARH